MESEQTPLIGFEEIRQRIDLFGGGVRNRLRDGAPLVEGTTSGGRSTGMNIPAGEEIEVQKTKIESEQTPPIDVAVIRKRGFSFDGGLRNRLRDGAPLVEGTTSGGRSTGMNIPAGEEIEVQKTKMESEQTPAIDVGVIRQRISLFDGGVRKHLGNGTVLVVGTTRGGKSTVLNILSGKEIEVHEIHGCATINVVGEKYAGIISAEGFKPMKIVHGPDSGTDLPNCVEVNDDLYWDCPGSFDNRGVDTEISNCYFVHKLLHNATEPGKKGVKFVLVQDYAGVGVAGGQTFTDMIETICTIFGPESLDDFNNLIDATTFVFNKVHQDCLPNDETSHEDFIKNIIDQVSTSMEVKQIEKLSSKKRARVWFIKIMGMKWKDLRYVAVPAARLSVPVNIVTDPILDPASGLIQKVKSCRQISDRKPKLAVSAESLNAVLLIQQHYEGLLTKRCRDLQDQLQDYFETLGLKGTLAFVEEVRPSLKEDEASIARGGGNRASLHMVKLLQDIVKDKNVTSILKTMENLVEQMSFFDMLIKNARSGFDFTRFITTVRMAAAKFLTMEDRKAFEKHENDLRAYITEHNSLSKVRKIFAAPAWFVTAAIHGTTWLLTKPCALVEKKIRNIKEDDTVSAKPAKATREVLHHLHGKVYGYLNKPNHKELEEKSKKINELIKVFEGK